MRNVLVIPILALLTIAVAAAYAQDPVTKTVGMKSMTFSPAAVEIKIGDTITWTNDDDRDHTVISTDKLFKSENLRAGESYSYKFTKAGKFAYTCTYHPRMKGTVTVKEK
jgi:plastocyanin